MIDELFAEFEGVFAENTTIGYRADFTRFANWCSNNGVVAGRPLPVKQVLAASRLKP